jgi:hypothetical protein
MSLRRDSVLFPQLHRVNISEMLQFAPLGFLGSIEMSLRRASALPLQFHKVGVIRDSTRHLLFSIAYDSSIESIIRYPIMWQNLSPSANYIK